MAEPEELSGNVEREGPDGEQKPQTFAEIHAGKCLDCKGTGTCPGCDGKGSHSLYGSESKVCFGCKGTGKCSTCGGTGKPKGKGGGKLSLGGLFGGGKSRGNGGDEGGEEEEKPSLGRRAASGLGRGALAGGSMLGRGALGAGRGLMGAASAIPKPTGSHIGWIIGIIVIAFVLLTTAAGTYVSAGVEKTGVGIKPAVEVGANVIKQGLGVIEKGPEVNLGGSESTEETKKEDRGIKITNLRPSRTLYESPSVVEIEGTVTAIGSGERQLSVRVDADVKDDVWQGLGLTGSLPMVCQIQGGKPGYAAKVKALELNNRLFRCSTCDTTTTPTCTCDKNIDGAQPGCFYAKSVMGKAKPGAINSLSVNIDATMLNTNTWSTRTIYFSSNDILFKTEDPAKEFGITERGSTQEGDDTIAVEVGVPGNPAAIAVTDPALMSLRGYSLYVRASSPVTSVGEATVSSVYLAVESPPVDIIDEGDFTEIPAGNVGSEVPREFREQFDDSSAYKFYKVASEVGKLGTESREYSLKFEILKDKLGNEKYRTFAAKAYVKYDYKTSKSTTIQVRALK